MPELLTVKQLQDILKVDRTTIYRMLNDGGLPGFKVGSQWRFSRQMIEEWLQTRPERKPVEEQPAPIDEPAQDVLPLTCVQAVQDVFGEALEVGAMTTDVAGNPLTEFSNCNPFCTLINSTEAGRNRCRQSWAELGHQQKEEPEIARCHAGLSYARGKIKVNGVPVAMIFAGQFRTEPPDETIPKSQLQELAAACDLPFESLFEAALHVPSVSREEAQRITRLLERIAYTFCHIGQERADLVGRLTHIAKITGPVLGRAKG